MIGVTLSFLVLTVGLGVCLIASQSVALSRTQVIADSVAHATAGFLAGDSKREALSRELQMHFTCHYEDKQPLQLDPNSGGDAGDANQLCGDALNAAKSVSTSNDKNARILEFTVTPDARGYVDSGGATNLDVAVTVATDSPLAKFPAFCSSPDGQSFCNVVANSAARESG